jgi:hypothetical protein
MLARLFANRTSCLLLRLTRSLELAASNRRLSAISNGSSSGAQRLIGTNAPLSCAKSSLAFWRFLQSRRAALVFGGEVTEPLTELETSGQSEPAPLHVQKVLLEPLDRFERRLSAHTPPRARSSREFARSHSPASHYCLAGESMISLSVTDA